MFLLDTNVISELRKIKAGKADLKVTEWALGIDAADLFISSITVMELEMGGLSVERRDKAQGSLLRSWQQPRCPFPTLGDRFCAN